MSRASNVLKECDDIGITINTGDYEVIIPSSMMKDYGYSEDEEGEYSHGDGSKIKVKDGEDWEHSDHHGNSTKDTGYKRLMHFLKKMRGRK